MAKRWEWQKEYCVGHEKIDTQHQLFFSWIDEFEQAVMSGQGGEQLGTTIERLVSYAKHHFAFEEHMMVRARYEAIAAHRALHEAFKADLAKMIKTYMQGGLRALDLSNFVGGWLRNHILNEDQKIKDAVFFLV